MLILIYFSAKNGLLLCYLKVNIFRRLSAMTTFQRSLSRSSDTTRPVYELLFSVTDSYRCRIFSSYVRCQPALECVIFFAISVSRIRSPQAPAMIAGGVWFCLAISRSVCLSLPQYSLRNALYSAYGPLHRFHIIFPYFFIGKGIFSFHCINDQIVC